MKTVLITGCSSGYGLETARHFHSQGWNVVATMRTPREDVLPGSERLRVLALDVTKADSIAAALEASGPIDVLVNNAGIGLLGAFEATPMATAREVFETNTFGVMAMTQAVLPQFRARRSGVVVNVTSSATLAPMPLVAVYTASKTAIEGFTGSLAHELEAFNVRVKLVEPGYAPTTRLTQNGQSRMEGLIPEAYAPYGQSVFAAFAQLHGIHGRVRCGRGGVACRERCVRATPTFQRAPTRWRWPAPAHERQVRERLRCRPRDGDRGMCQPPHGRSVHRPGLTEFCRIAISSFSTESAVSSPSPKPSRARRFIRPRPTMSAPQ